MRRRQPATGRWREILGTGSTSRAILLALLAVIALVGCGESDQEGQGGPSEDAGATPRGSAPPPEERAAQQSLSLFVFFRPPTFDPALQGPATLGGNALRRQYTEALLKPEPATVEAENSEVTGAAAESVEVSEDGLAYTFRLREDGRFNDGTPVTADDFVFAWRRLIDPRLASPTGRVFAGVVEGGEEAAALGPEASDATIERALDNLGLRAVDARTFEVTLADPAPYFEWIAALTAGAPLSEEVVREEGDDWATEPETLITNGPFKVADIGQSETTMVPNEHYREAPILKEIVAGYGLEPAPRWARYLNDELDISNGPPPAIKEATLADPRFQDEIVRFPELSNQWLQFNTNKPPFDNPKVRLAFAQAIDRGVYVEAGTEPIERPLTTLIPKGMPGYSPELGGAQQFDPQKARATLEGAGVDPQDLEDLEIVTGPPQEPDALFLKEQFETNLGVTTTVTSIGDSAQRESALEQGEYDMRTTFVGHVANYPDPQDFFSVFLSENPENPGGYQNPEYDRLVERANTTADEAEREQLYDQAHRILVEDAPVAFLAQLERVFYVKPWVRGLTRTPIDGAAFPGDFYSPRIGIAER